MRHGLNSKYANLLSFIDLLFNLMLGFAGMFLLSLAMITVAKNQTETIKKQAEYFVRIEWQGDHDSDVDMWLQDPRGEIIGYKDKQHVNMYLERDNLGNDPNLKDPGHINEEIASILKVLPGWYTINLHWFERRSNSANPVIKWSVIKMKPSMQTVASGTVELQHKGQEITAVRLRMNQDGQLIQTNTDVQNLFVLKKLGRDP